MARPRSPHYLPVSRSPSVAAGFSLPELLVAVAIGAVLVVTGITTLTSHFSNTARLEARNRLQDHWGRVNLLLENEIAEADTITTVGNCFGAASQLTLNVRNNDQVDTTVPILYAVDGNGDLLRCGPPVLVDGSLDFSVAAVTSRLVPNAQLQVQLPGNPPTGRLPTYTLSLTDPISGITYANQVSANRARVRVIN